MTAPHSPLDSDVEALTTFLERERNAARNQENSTSFGFIALNRRQHASDMSVHLTTVQRMAARIAELEREAGGFSGPLGEVPSTARRK